MKNTATQMNLEALLTAMYAADEAFRKAVIAQFGRKDAGTMRYMSSKHNDATKAASKLFHEAATTFLDAKREADRQDAVAA